MNDERGRLAAPVAITPGEFERSRETTWRARNAAVRVSGFKASPDGLFVTVTVLGDAVVVNPLAGFGGPNPSDASGPSVWLTERRRTISSEIQGGDVLHPEQPGDAAVSTYQLWFPLDLASVDEDAELHVSWPSVLGRSDPVRLTAHEMRAAAAKALVWRIQPSH